MAVFKCKMCGGTLEVEENRLCRQKMTNRCSPYITEQTF